MKVHLLETPTRRWKFLQALLILALLHGSNSDADYSNYGEGPEVPLFHGGSQDEDHSFPSVALTSSLARNVQSDVQCD